MITYIETLDTADKFAMIWNYIQIVEVCKFAWSILKDDKTYNYTLDDKYKII